jgi:hypothetical protein
MENRKSKLAPGGGVSWYLSPWSVYNTICLFIVQFLRCFTRNANVACALTLQILNEQLAYRVQE